MSQVKTIASVRFHTVGKVYHFDATRLPQLARGDFVVVETTRGRQIGEVVMIGPPTQQTVLESIKPIERVATGRDMAIARYWRDREPEALAACSETARRLDLPLKVVNAEYSFDGTRLLFLYTAEDKLETQALKQELGRSFRSRVDLKLVGPRDVAKLLGGYGACGELRCCSTFLTDFSSISIKMAKDQAISLNPQEITGMCGRLRCCLQYEHEQYSQARHSLPKRGKEIGTPYGRGVVVEVLPLKEAVVVAVGEQQYEVAAADLLPLEECKEAPSAPQPEGEPRRQRRKSARAGKPGLPDQPKSLAAAPDAAASTEKGEAPRRRRRRKKRPSEPGAVTDNKRG